MNNIFFSIRTYQFVFRQTVATIIIVFLQLICLQVRAQGDSVLLSVDHKNVTGHVDKKIYGQLLEHIYHSINGGLWGELIASRSFEPVAYKGWYLDKGDMISAGTRTNVISIGNPNWTNYEINLEAKWSPFFIGVPAPWSGGQSDIRFLFRGNTPSASYAFHLDASKNEPFTLERGSLDSNGHDVWRTLASSKITNNVSLENQFWHRIKIRCEGPYFTVFWDDRIVLKYTDSDGYLQHGQFGLLLTRTTGRFRNIQINDLTGKSLWKGFPKEILPPPVAPNWIAYGNGTFELTEENPRNRYYAQRITAQKFNESGVKQVIPNVKAGETYQGSIWARGNGAARLTVKMLVGEHTMAAVVLGKPGKKWKEFYFTLKADRNVQQAYLAMGITGGTVCLDQASLFAKSNKQKDKYRPDLYEAVKSLGPTLLRWPGGSFASGYNWEWGIGPQVSRIRTPKTSWDDYEQNAFGTDEFITLCHKLNAEPVIVVPIGYDRPDGDRQNLIRQAQDWLAYCNAPTSNKWGKLRSINGHPKPYHVKYWEIDNEMWEMGVEKYNELLREFVPALKKIDSTIKIIACGDFTEKGINRDSILLYRSGRMIDYLSLHHYENPNNMDIGPGNSARKFQNFARLIKSSPNPDIKLFISEWNADGVDWRTGLYAAGILNVFEREPSVEMASAALLLRRNDATGWDNAFINFDQYRWFAAPNYVVAKFYKDHYAPNRLAVSGDINKINVIATGSLDHKILYIKAINPTNKPMPVRIVIPNYQINTDQRLEIVGADSLKAQNTMTNPNLIKVVVGKVTHNKDVWEYTLPKLSVGILTVCDKK